MSAAPEVPQQAQFDYFTAPIEDPRFGEQAQASHGDALARKYGVDLASLSQSVHESEAARQAVAPLAEQPEVVVSAEKIPAVDPGKKEAALKRVGELDSDVVSDDYRKFAGKIDAMSSEQRAAALSADPLKAEWYKRMLNTPEEDRPRPYQPAMPERVGRETFGRVEGPEIPGVEYWYDPNEHEGEAGEDYPHQFPEGDDSQSGHESQPMVYAEPEPEPEASSSSATPRPSQGSRRSEAAKVAGRALESSADRMGGTVLMGLGGSKDARDSSGRQVRVPDERKFIGAVRVAQDRVRNGKLLERLPAGSVDISKMELTPDATVDETFAAELRTFKSKEDYNKIVSRLTDTQFAQLNALERSARYQRGVEFVQRNKRTIMAVGAVAVTTAVVGAMMYVTKDSSHAQNFPFNLPTGRSSSTGATGHAVTTLTPTPGSSAGTATSAAPTTTPSSAGNTHNYLTHVYRGRHAQGGNVAQPPAGGNVSAQPSVDRAIQSNNEFASAHHGQTQPLWESFHQAGFSDNQIANAIAKAKDAGVVKEDPAAGGYFLRLTSNNSENPVAVMNILKGYIS